MIEKNRSHLSLEELIASAKAHLKQQGYAENTIALYSGTWNQLLLYASERGTKHFNIELGQEFLQYRYKITLGQKLSSNQTPLVRRILALSDYQLHGIIFPRTRKRKYTWPPQFETIFNEFVTNQEDLGYDRRNIQAVKLYLERFAEFLDNKKIMNFSDITVDVIFGFIEIMVRYNKSTVAHTLRALRHLFKYAYSKDYISEDLSNSIPSVKFNRRTSIPSAYTTEEVERLLSSVDRGNREGKRDYVILLLASRLGLRASDIRNLKFENIKWDTNTIDIVQQKTGGSLSLPLLTEIGEAIIDYLKYGRPKSDSKNVFIRHTAPYNQFPLQQFHHLMVKYMQLAKIPIDINKKHGIHSLRHSLASSLLEKGTPMPVISGILDHQDPDTTSIYLKIDIEQLRMCALEVPYDTEQ